MASREEILAQVGRISSSSLFENAARSRTLLEFLAREVVEGRAGRLKEYTIGSEGLGRGDSFDPRTDTIVRAEASRLRSRLERYYASEGQGDALVIELPKGRYVLEFRERDTFPSAAAGSDTPRRRILRGAAAALAVIVPAILVWTLTRKPVQSEPPPITLEVELQSPGLVGSTVGTDVIVSPDGTRLAFIAQDRNGISRIHVYPFDLAETHQLPGTEGARAPFFSPDSRWIGFWSAGKLKKTPVEQGGPLVVCDAPDLLGASWNADGSIIASFGGQELWQVPASGGTPRSLIPAPTSKRRIWPQVLPGKNAVIYTAAAEGGADLGTVEILSMDSGTSRVLVDGGTFGRVLSGDFLTFVRQGTLYAVRFDADRLELSGSPQPILDNVAYDASFGFAQLDVSDSGTLVYRKNGGATLQWLSEGGRTEPILARAGRYLWPSLAPDGRRLAVTKTEGGQSAVWIYDFDRATTNLVAHGLHFTAWSPDSKHLVFGGVNGLRWVDPEQPSEPRELLATDGVYIPTSFRPDGGLLAFHCRNSESHFDLCTMPVSAAQGTLRGGERSVILETESVETYPMISPDGRWIAYVSNETGAWEVYTDAFPSGGVRAKISSGGGRIPRWSSDSRQLFYRSPDQRIMVASLRANGKGLSVGDIRPWAMTQLYDTGVFANFDVGPKDRIAALLPAAQPEDRQSANHVTVMMNFFNHVRRRMSSGD